MALFPSIESAESDSRHHVRTRLVALRRAPGQLPDSVDLDDADPDNADSNDADPGIANDPLSAGKEGRLVRRWVPTALRDARWEPGKPGALMLSLVAALAAVLAAVGVWRERPVPAPAPALPLVAAATDAPAPAAAAPKMVISVMGRVARPGLVRLPDGSRVADALDAVGGALPDTDLVALNLARKLSDGEQVLVGTPPSPGQPADGGVTSSPAGTSPVVDLNTATVAQLDALPGVGPVTAQRILDWRAAHGRFQSVNQLREVSGIGEARFTRLKELVRV